MFLNGFLDLISLFKNIYFSISKKRDLITIYPLYLDYSKSFCMAATVRRKKRNARRYLLCDVISQFGSGMSFVSLNWFVFQKTGDSNSVGIVMLLGILGGVIAAFFAGAISDHFNRKSILVFSNFLRALFISVIICFMSYNQFNILFAYLLAFVGGLGLHVYMSASRAFMQELIDQKDIVRWQSFIEVSIQASMLVSGLLTGILYNLFGIKVILGIEVLSFFVSNILLYTIEHESLVYKTVKDRLIHKYAQGYHYLRSHVWMFIFAVIMVLPYVATVMLNTVMPHYVSNHLGSDVVMYGIMNMSYGVGGGMAGLVIMYVLSKYSHVASINICLSVGVMALMFLFFNRDAMVSSPLFFFFGLSNSSIKIILNSILMKNVSNEYMGRALSVVSLTSAVLQMLATYVVSVMIDRYIGLNSIIFLVLVMAVSYGCFVWYLPKYRKYLQKRVSV